VGRKTLRKSGECDRESMGRKYTGKLDMTIGLVPQFSQVTHAELAKAKKTDHQRAGRWAPFLCYGYHVPV